MNDFEKDLELTTACEKNTDKKTVKKRFSALTVAISILVALLVGVSGTIGVLYMGPLGKAFVKLKEIDLLVNENFVGQIDYSQLERKILSGYVSGLDDRYGFYREPQSAEEIADSFEGSTFGIGVTVYNGGSSLNIFRIDAGGPADKVGIKVGDKIVAIDQKKVAELGYEESIEFIKREIGQKAEITIDRSGTELEFEVEYKDFVRQTVYTHIVENIGYMLITSFNSATVTQFNADLDMLIQKGVKGIIFDVRDNSGGTVDSVCEILDRLVGECNLMTVEYSDGNKKVTHRSDKKEVTIPMAVLTNKNTESAAELFAATIRDMNKGPLVGQTTFGKGVMQTTYFLSDGSCVRFTTGYYYPVGGECYDKIGLTPDYEVEFTEQQAKNPYVLGDDDPYIQKALEVIDVEK